MKRQEAELEKFSNGRKKILLVDDEKDFAEMMSFRLEEKGHRVKLAFSGQEALDTLAENHTDVVIMDIRMPGLDGIETLRRLRATDSDLPVIVLTGHGGFDEAVAGIKLDIVDFVHKPVDIERLGVRIRRLLARAAQPMTLRERTIAELIDIVNEDPRRGIGHEKVLTRLELDHQAQRLARGQARAAQVQR